MTRRGFIIGIENYAQMQEGLARTLPGTHRNALAFYDWLVTSQHVAPSDIWFCTEDAKIPQRTAGADRDDIVAELLRLKTAGKDRTDELYVFFSGHGFCYTDADGVSLADVLVAANYRDRGISGATACLKLNEIQQWLKRCLGPRDHYYFIDACRNTVTERDIKVGVLGLPYDVSRLGLPTVYTLYSAVEGAVVAVGSEFTDVLVAGLKGTGRAKAWRGANMAVLFRSVKEYVAGRLKHQPVDERKEGSGDGVILELAPPPTYTCQLVVENAAVGDSFSARVTTVRGSPVEEVTFSKTGNFTNTPDEYNIVVQAPDMAVVPLDPLPADLYENCTVRFRKKEAVRGRATSAPPGPARVTVQAPNGTKVVIRDLARGDVGEHGEAFTMDLHRGRYLMLTVDNRGVTVGRREVRIDNDQPITLDLADFEHSTLRDAVLTETAGNHFGGAVDFSETLGPIPDQGLDLWLGLIGASRIVGDPHDFQKLGRLQLVDFSNVQPGYSSLYVLAGFDDQATRVSVAISPTGTAAPAPVRGHARYPGLFEVRADAEPGADYHLVSVQVDDATPLTVGTFTLSNRVTLVTITRTDRRELRVQQFVLPLAHLRPFHPDQTRYFLDQRPLSYVRRMVEIQRQFGESKDLRALLGQDELNEVLYVKWLEPIVSILAAYELARRGLFQDLPEVVKNLTDYFGLAPDVAALSSMVGLPRAPAAHPPLVLDGLLALNLMGGQLPLPADALDFRGPWTAWRSAVPAPRR